MNKNVLICGVGGQGTVLASKLLASAHMRLGNVVHSAETIGMAQRGGSVTSHVRIGNEAHSPLIPLGKADVIMAFEPAEAVRNLDYLKDDGIVIVNSVPVKPTTESLHDTGYDGTVMIEYLKKVCKHLIVVDAGELCASLGSDRYFNVAVLGVLVGTKKLDIDEETVVAEIKERINARFVETNLKALHIGIETGGKYAVK